MGIIRWWFSFVLLFITIAAYGDEFVKPKIISLTPSFTDMVVDLGATDQLVGATILDKQRIPTLKSLDSVGNFGSYSLEKIVSLKPDIVLIWPSAINPVQQQQLSSVGIRVISRDPQTLSDLGSDIIYLGKQIGKEKEGEQLSARLRAELSQLKNQYHRDRPLTVFYQVWDKPMYTIGKKQIINDALNICGARNIFDDVDSPAPQVNVESVLARNPQVIISSNQSLLDSWRSWTSLAAVANNKLILFQDDRIARPSIEMVEAIKKLCVQINE